MIVDNKNADSIDLLAELQSAAPAAEDLALVRPGSDEVAFLPFTSTATPVDLHFCGEPELNSYVRCLGDDCLLCRIGKSKTTRRLLPVYLPIERQIGVLPIATTLTPKALLPQLASFLRAEQLHVVFASRQGQQFHVHGAPLQEGEDDGRETIASFQQRVEEGAVDLRSVYLALQPADLLEIEPIARLARLKGVAG